MGLLKQFNLYVRRKSSSGIFIPKTEIVSINFLTFIHRFQIFSGRPVDDGRKSKA